MNKYRALILNSPGARGERFLIQSLSLAGFDPEVLDVQGVLDYRIDMEQLCLKYRLVVLPGGSPYSSILGGGKALALKIENVAHTRFLRIMLGLPPVADEPRTGDLVVATVSDGQVIGRLDDEKLEEIVAEVRL